MRLATAEVDRYGPLVDCRPPCREGLTVLSGPNEAGKTLYLEALLQLLDPDVGGVMEPAARVDQPPTGRVVVEHAGERYECDGETTLGDVAAIESTHLQSVFVVRDNDLHLPSEQQYYTSLIEKLGDIHTTEIAAVKDTLREKGRLMDKRLDISSDQSYDHAGDVHETAETLAREIRDYVETIEAENLDNLDAERLRTKRRLREVRDRLGTQREARAAAEYDRLSDRLATYRETSEQRSELDAFDRETLEELRAIRNDLERDREHLDELADAIERKATDVERTRETVQELRQRASALERREPAVGDVRSALQTYRDRQDDTARLHRRLRLTRAATVAGLVAAGVAGAAGAVAGSSLAVVLGGLLLVVGTASGLGYLHTSRRLGTTETAAETVLREARDAGFEVESATDVAPAIDAFETELSNVRDRLTAAELNHENATEALDDLRREKSEVESRISDRETQLDDRLESAGVDSIEEYASRVETVDELAAERRAARQSLVDRFGEPESTEPTAKADEWAAALADSVTDLDLDAVDPDAYDEVELDRLEDEVAELEARVDELDERLRVHDRTLDDFDQRARDLTTRPFVGHGLELESRTGAGLESLADDLESVVERLEWDAEVSRKALSVFDDIETQEEQKLAELFAPDGPASNVFERLTDGRYTAVAYDADDHALVVERRDGRRFGPEVLSQATTDQLYLATRVSLARQLLGNEPGFLLLDDPFLAADPDRLRRGFEALDELAAEGWQILYLTAKQEVRETMVDEFGLDHVELETVTFGT